MVPQTVVRFVVVGVLLIAGAELLVRGGSRLAIGLGISPPVVGLTVVAFGTSSPSLAVTAGSAYRARPTFGQEQPVQTSDTYLAYTLYLMLDAGEHAVLAPFSAATAWFVLPLTGLTPAVVAWRASGRGMSRATP